MCLTCPRLQFPSTNGFAKSARNNKKKIIIQTNVLLIWSAVHSTSCVWINFMMLSAGTITSFCGKRSFLFCFLFFSESSLSLLKVIFDFLYSLWHTVGNYLFLRHMLLQIVHKIDFCFCSSLEKLVFVRNEILRIQNKFPVVWNYFATTFYSFHLWNFFY